ncbi:MAG: hypothetical protein Q4C35_12740, partial [Eubacteriales bacterium]|nr:hypothetical protein [Eubacteriales bacterium]
MSKRLMGLALCLALVFTAALALAEDCFTIDVDTLDMDSLNRNDYVAAHLSAGAQGVRVVKRLSDSSELAVSVRLTLTQMDSGTLLFDKDYGFQSGSFDSGVIYLPFVNGSTVPYLVTLYAGDYVYAMPFMHLQPRLAYNGACTYGVRLRDLGLSGDWMMGTMVDLNALRSQGSMAVDICASNSYVIGQAVFCMQGESLLVTVSCLGQANVEIHSQTLYVATNCAGLPAQGFSTYAPGDLINVSGAASALVCLNMQVSYDPAGLSAFQYNASSSQIQSQLALWEQNRSGQGKADAAGSQAEDSGGWADSGEWVGSSGWEDNSGWTDNSG